MAYHFKEVQYMGCWTFFPIKILEFLFQYIWENWGTLEDYKKFGEKKNRKKIMGMKIMGKSYDR